MPSSDALTEDADPHGQPDPRVHPRPTVHGVQSALVVGLEAPVHTDRDHRIKVQFHWQRGANASHRLEPAAGGSNNAPASDASGTWMRVSQTVADANWGINFIPRLGQEVLSRRLTLILKTTLRMKPAEMEKNTPGPAVTGSTNPKNKGKLTIVSVTPPRKVTYLFKATSSSNLRIPYAVAIDGVALPAFSSKPKRVAGAGGRVETFVDQGKKVGLFLNSDAHPSYRKELVYEVTAGASDIEITLSKTAGQHTIGDAPVLQSTRVGGRLWIVTLHRLLATFG